MARGRFVGTWVLLGCMVFGACSSTTATSGTSRPSSTATTRVTDAETPTTPPGSATPDTDTRTSDPAKTVDSTKTAATTATTEPTDPPDTTATPTTEAVTFDSLDSTEAAAPTAPCGFTPPVPMGEVTWVQDGQLRALADGALPTCLLDGVPDTPAVAWSSDAGRVLTDPTSASTANGTRPTGFDGSNPSVTLSAPTGTATIGIDPATHRLIRHGSDGAVSDISFLASTDAAIYHPNGKRIVAVGTDEGGAYGIWLSSNLGKEPKQILSVADPATPVTDLAFSADGTSLYFVHGFVHRLIFNGLALIPIGIEGRPEADLVVSKLEEATAWSIGPCDETGTVMLTSPVLGSVIDIRNRAGSPFANSAVTIRPVGWLSGDRLVLATRPSGCSGPADVWVWSPVDGFHHVAHDALAPAVRVPRGATSDLPDLIEEAAPG